MDGHLLDSASAMQFVFFLAEDSFGALED